MDRKKSVTLEIYGLPPTIPKLHALVARLTKGVAELKMGDPESPPAHPHTHIIPCITGQQYNQITIRITAIGKSLTHFPSHALLREVCIHPIRESFALASIIAHISINGQTMATEDQSSGTEEGHDPRTCHYCNYNMHLDKGGSTLSCPNCGETSTVTIN